MNSTIPAALNVEIRNFDTRKVLGSFEMAAINAWDRVNSIRDDEGICFRHIESFARKNGHLSGLYGSISLCVTNL
jgi:hypothetical protein